VTLTERAIDHLRRIADLPDLRGTRYELLGEIARGGMGTVYRARDRELGRDVALKVLHLAELGDDARARLIREARILARLEHPGIVPVHDLGRLDDGRVFYTMKLVEGARLDQHVGGLRGLRERLRIFERICEAVAFAHAHGVIHRDLKPGNVMVGAFGEVLVMDWGVAKILEAAGPADATGGARAGIELSPGSDRVGLEPPADADQVETLAAAPGAAGQTRPGVVLGTPGYMAPEQAAGRAELVDRRSDVYALGILLRELVTGVERTTPRRLEAILRKAAATAPSERYDRVEDLRADISRLLDGERVSAYREGPLDVFERWLERYRTPILLILTYLLVRALILLFGGL
jgi:serine/threonine-protein kinase